MNYIVIDQGTSSTKGFLINFDGQILHSNKINYIDKPYTRFEGTEFEQNTFFIEDPNGNVLELKTFD